MKPSIAFEPKKPVIFLQHQNAALQPGLRAEQPGDKAFVYQLFAETRLADLAPLQWDRSQIDAFLQQQFTLQAAHFQANYPTADYSIIQLGDHAIGRLYVNRTSYEIRVIDITLIPEYRNQGIGHFLLQGIIEEAKATTNVIRLHVEQTNPALRLYQRLGFHETKDQGVYLEIAWHPSHR